MCQHSRRLKTDWKKLQLFITEKVKPNVTARLSEASNGLRFYAEVAN